MMIARDEIISSRLHKVAAVALLLTTGALASGCSHPAAPPTAAVPVAAPTETPAPDTTGASKMSPEDQATNAQAQHKGQGAPP